MKQQILKLRDEGKPFRSIAKELGVSLGVVASTVRRRDAVPAVREINYPHHIGAYIDGGMFDDLHVVCREQGWTLSEAIRNLVEWGLESYNEQREE